MAKLCASARCDRPGCTDRHPYHNTDGKIYKSIRPLIGQIGLLSDEMNAEIPLTGSLMIPKKTSLSEKLDTQFYTKGPI